MTRDFPPLELAAASAPLARQEVTFHIAEGDPAAAAGLLDAVLRRHVAPGDLGGYVAPGVPADRSHFRLVSAAEVSKGTVVFVVEAEYVDPRAFQILRNMIARLTEARTAVTRIVVRQLSPGVPRGGELAPASDENEDEVYPPLSNQLRFPIEWVNTQFSKSRRCEVEYSKPLGAPEVLEITRRVETWGRVLQAGGFATPAGLPGEVESVYGGVSQFDEYTVEIEVARFKASETAWNVVANLLDAHGRAASGVVKIVVE
jgi:hypothetical protein